MWSHKELNQIYCITQQSQWGWWTCSCVSVFNKCLTPILHNKVSIAFKTCVPSACIQTMEWHLIHFFLLGWDVILTLLYDARSATQRDATRRGTRHTLKNQDPTVGKKNSLSAFTSWVSSYSHIKARRFRPFPLCCIWKECGLHYLFLFNDCVARVAEQYLPMATSKYNFISTHPQTIHWFQRCKITWPVSVGFFFLPSHLCTCFPTCHIRWSARKQSANQNSLVR